MNIKLLVTGVLVASLFGCATNKGVEPPQVTAIASQKLTTTFKRENIKVEWDCMWGTGLFEATCVKNHIKAIEATGYAASFGNSEALRENAFLVAHDQALAKLIRFVKQDVTTTRVVNTMSKNIEKASDRIKTKINLNEEVAMSDEDASKDTNYAIRQNTNDTVRRVTETIRSNSQGIVRGARVVDEKVVDRQTVAVTIRWDLDYDKGANQLRKRFSM